MAHAGSCFLASPFKESAILTVDGVGEWTTTAYGYGNGNEIKLMREIKFPHSLGLLYSTVTAYLGFSVNNSEYKVMGLSSYGNKNSKTNTYYRKLKKICNRKLSLPKAETLRCRLIEKDKGSQNSENPSFY